MVAKYRSKVFAMNQREQYKKLIMFLASAVLMTGLTLIFSYVWYRDYVFIDMLLSPFHRGRNYTVIALYVVMLFTFFTVYGGFQAGSQRIFEAMTSQCLAVVCTNVVTYLQLCILGNWLFLTHFGPMVVVTVVDFVVLLIWSLGTRWAYTKLFPPRRLLVVYGKYSPEDLIMKIASREDKYAIQEAVHYEVGFEGIVEKIDEYGNVILMDIPAIIRNKLLKYCFENNIRCYSVPKISDIMIKSASEIHLFDTSLLLSRNMGLTVDQRLLKRALDIVLSLILIVLTAPIMLIVALLVKLYDGGPVFFKQDRLTRNKKVFKVIKFRSMRVQNENAEYVMTRKNDDRITPVGKILRNIHFDELPQLFNILKGDMSFVGPRPECPHLAEEYRQIVPEFDYRLKVKAGLTGFAQVYGKYNTAPYDKLKLDLTYIQNYSFWLDLKLILLTVKVLFHKENTEGIEAWQKTAATKENLEKIGK